MANFFQKTGDLLGFDGQFGLQNNYDPAVSAPPRKPTIQSYDPSQTPPPRKPSQSTGFSLGGASDFLNNAANTVKTGFDTYFNVKSQFRQAELAEDLEEIKLDAIRKSANQAPAAAQVILPTVSDFLNDPREAASRVTPAALAGSGVVQTGMGMAQIFLLGVAAYFLFKR